MRKIIALLIVISIIIINFGCKEEQQEKLPSATKNFLSFKVDSIYVFENIESPRIPFYFSPFGDKDKIWMNRNYPYPNSKIRHVEISEVDVITGEKVPFSKKFKIDFLKIEHIGTGKVYNHIYMSNIVEDEYSDDIYIKERYGAFLLKYDSKSNSIINTNISLGIFEPRPNDVLFSNKHGSFSMDKNSFDLTKLDKDTWNRESSKKLAWKNQIKMKYRDYNTMRPHDIIWCCNGKELLYSKDNGETFYEFTKFENGRTNITNFIEDVENIYYYKSFYGQPSKIIAINKDYIFNNSIKKNLEEKNTKHISKLRFSKLYYNQLDFDSIQLKELLYTLDTVHTNYAKYNHLSKRIIRIEDEEIIEHTFDVNQNLRKAYSKGMLKNVDLIEKMDKAIQVGDLPETYLKYVLEWLTEYHLRNMNFEQAFHYYDSLKGFLPNDNDFISTKIKIVKRHMVSLNTDLRKQYQRGELQNKLVRISNTGYSIDSRFFNKEVYKNTLNKIIDEIPNSIETKKAEIKLLEMELFGIKKYFNSIPKGNVQLPNFLYDERTINEFITYHKTRYGQKEFALNLSQNKNELIAKFTSYIRKNCSQKREGNIAYSSSDRTIIRSFWNITLIHLLSSENSKQEEIIGYRQALNNINDLRNEFKVYLSDSEKKYIDKIIGILNKNLLNKYFDIKIVPLKESFANDEPVSVEATIFNNTSEPQDIELLSGKLFFKFHKKNAYGYGRQLQFKESTVPLDTIRSTVTIESLGSIQQTIILNQDNVIFNEDGKLGYLTMDKNYPYYANLSLLNKFEPQLVKIFIE